MDAHAKQRREGDFKNMTKAELERLEAAEGSADEEKSDEEDEEASDADEEGDYEGNYFDAGDGEDYVMVVVVVTNCRNGYQNGLYQVPSFHESNTM